MAGRAQVLALILAVRSGSKAVKGALIGYKLGIRTDLDVLSAEHALYRAKRGLARAQYRTLLEGFKLKAAVGTLTERDVRAIGALLVSRPHLRRSHERGPLSEGMPSGVSVSPDAIGEDTQSRIR